MTRRRVAERVGRSPVIRIEFVLTLTRRGEVSVKNHEAKISFAIPQIPLIEASNLIYYCERWEINVSLITIFS